MENVKLFLSQKSQFFLVEKIKNENKNRIRTSLFQFSEDGKQEFFMWPNYFSVGLFELIKMITVIIIIKREPPLQE